MNNEEERGRRRTQSSDQDVWGGETPDLFAQEEEPRPVRRRSAAEDTEEVRSVRRRPATENRDEEERPVHRRHPAAEAGEEEVRPVRRRPAAENADGEVRPARRRPVTESETGETRSVRRRPAAENTDGEGRPVRRRPAVETADGENRPVRRRPVTESETGEVRPTRRRPVTETADGEVRPTRRRPAAENASEQEHPVRRRTQQNEFADPSVNRNAAYEGEEEREERRKPKNGRKKAAIPLVILLVVLLGLLAVAIWQLKVVQDGGNSFLNRLLGSSSGTPGATVPRIDAGVTTEADTEAAQSLGDAVDEEQGADGTQAAQTAAVESRPAQTTEAQTYETDENGNMIVPERQPGSFETEPAWESTLQKTGDDTLDQANRLAAMYDYDSAIALLQGVSGYDGNQTYKDAVASYEDQKSQAVQYADNSTIPHVFFHTLIVDTSRAFDDTIAISKQDGMNKVKDYNYVMTTITEFCRILDQMYEEGYVLVSIYDVASYETQADGTQVMKHQPIYLPEGKKPFVLSVDDVSYYEYMEGHGFASKLVVGEDGTPISEYDAPDGTVMYGAYDVVPILDDFVDAHPDFSYRGAKGIIALTGYEGIFGYRTSDYWYNSNCDYFDQYFTWNLEANTKKKQTMYYDNPNIEQDKAAAKAVADACRADGWLFASHTWGHNKVGDSGSYERFYSDSMLWDKEVKPLLGEVDIIIYPQGEDLYEGSWRGYDPANEKYQLLKQLGFSYFCSVDSNLGWTQLGTEYFRMGRANADGQRMWEAISSYVNPGGTAIDRLSALFDSRLVFDWSRPTPVEK